MNKKAALVTLIETTLLLSSEEKLDLIDAVPTFNDRQVDALGKYLALGREAALATEGDIMKNIQEKLEHTEPKVSDKTIFVGSGKPSS